jgi:hypothetical protein
MLHPVRQSLHLRGHVGKLIVAQHRRLTDL